MRVAMVIDEQRLVQEQRLLNRLGVGLMAEGVQLTRIVPAGPLHEGERGMGLAPRIQTPMTSLPWMRRLHVQRLFETLEDNPPDALYLVGSNTWALGLGLAKALDRPALLEVWSAALAPTVPRLAAQPHIAGVVAPCAGITKALRDHVDAEILMQVPMGVATPRRARRPLDDRERAPAIAILGGARDVPAYTALLGGLARVVKNHPALQVFLELRGRHEHDIWRQAERLGLLGAVSAIGAAEQHRALLLRCDVVLWPERFGELRSILLEAMAMGLPVVAASDNALDMLVDGETASLVFEASEDHWARSLSAILDDPPRAQALGLRGREHVVTSHRSSEQVQRLMAALAQVAGQDAYAFPRPAS